jgi:hypothetical protein
MAVYQGFSLKIDYGTWITTLSYPDLVLFMKIYFDLHMTPWAILGLINLIPTFMTATTGQICKDLETAYIPACQQNKSGTFKAKEPLYPLPISDT